MESPRCVYPCFSWHASSLSPPSPNVKHKIIDVPKIHKCFPDVVDYFDLWIKKRHEKEKATTSGLIRYKLPVLPTWTAILLACYLFFLPNNPPAHRDNPYYPVQGSSLLSARLLLPNPFLICGRNHHIVRKAVVDREMAKFDVILCRKQECLR